MTLTGPAPDTEDADAGAGFTSDEMMTVAASRALRDGVVCFVGIGLPSTAANLARTTHAPNLVLVYESGAIGAKPSRLPLSIGDAELAETADTVVSVPEIFNYWLQAGPDRRRVPVGGPIGPPRQPEQHRDRALRSAFGTPTWCRRGAGDSRLVR